MRGHIPSSVHLEYILTLNEDGTFKSFDELKTLYDSNGITPDKEVFPYCAIGGRSGLYLVRLEIFTRLSQS